MTAEERAREAEVMYENSRERYAAMTAVAETQRLDRQDARRAESVRFRTLTGWLAVLFIVVSVCLTVAYVTQGNGDAEYWRGYLAGQLAKGKN